MVAELTISKLVEAAGVNIETIRYYQRHGLLDAPAKPFGGHRRYSPEQAKRVRFINTLAAAHTTGNLKREMSRYLKPRILLIDELGYLPIDKFGADALFQIISHRYECSPVIITSNRVFKNWPEIFNNDSTLTSALLDRLLHHAETVVIEGKSYRMKDQIET